MAREINAELLDTKIEKAQKDLVKAKHRYDAAAATLKDLLDKRDALRQKKLLDAIAQSGRSYEEIMQYLHSKSEEAFFNDSACLGISEIKDNLRTFFM